MMIFSSQKKERNSCPNLVINGAVIEKVTEYEYLGVCIDDRLSWDKHIQKVIAKCASLCGILRKLSKFVPVHVLLKIYHSFIHSRYQYGISAWGTGNKVHFKPMLIQQNRCIKAIFSLPYLFPTLDLYELPQHQIPPILGLHMLQVGISMYKIINELNIHHNWSFGNALHPHHTRYAHHLRREQFRTEIGRRRFSNIGPIIYNKIPDNIKAAPTLFIFKLKLKQFILNNPRNMLVN